MADPTENLEYAWCHFRFLVPNGDTLGKCLNEFKKQRKLAFNPLSYYGVCNHGRCHLIMYCSITPSAAVEFAKLRFEPGLGEFPPINYTDPVEKLEVLCWAINDFSFDKIHGIWTVVGHIPNIGDPWVDFDTRIKLLEEFEEDAKAHKFVKPKLNSDKAEDLARTSHEINQDDYKGV